VCRLSLDVLCGVTFEYAGLNESVGKANSYEGPIKTDTSFRSLTAWKIESLVTENN